MAVADMRLYRSGLEQIHEAQDRPNQPQHHPDVRHIKQVLPGLVSTHPVGFKYCTQDRQYARDHKNPDYGRQCMRTKQNLDPASYNTDSNSQVSVPANWGKECQNAEQRRQYESKFTSRH